MRKTLLTLVAVLLSFSAYGADIFENWEEKSSFGPATNGGTSAVKGKRAQAESTVHMLNWAIRSVKFLGVEFD